MSQATPANSESKPATMNRSGSVIDGAAAANGVAIFFAARDAGLAVADASKVASIRLLLGFTDESALFEFGDQPPRPPLRARENRRAVRQRGVRFENFHERLRRFETAQLEFDGG